MFEAIRALGLRLETPKQIFSQASSNDNLKQGLGAQPEARTRNLPVPAVSEAVSQAECASGFLHRDCRTSLAGNGGRLDLEAC